ncbi:polysaccharide biosynthesis protein [Bacteroidia bacterium]|nr:polysaccharide biosynthesis protein [Bacteroidia bacterium]
MGPWNNIKKVYSSEFFKYSAALLSSNAISQLIGIAAYPFITRIYSPEIFGEFTFFLSIVGILAIFPTGRYELAIILPKSEKKAIALFQLCILLNGLFFLLSSFIIVIWKAKIASFFHQESLLALLPFLPFLVLLTGLWQTFNYYFIRQKKYYNISAYNITQSIIGSGLKCVLGIKGFLQSGLVWGTLSGQFFAIIISLIAGKSQLKEVKKTDKAKIMQTAKTYVNFPKFELPNELLNTFAGSLPVLLLSFYFKMGEIGLFSLALTVGFRPVNLFSTSVYQVLFRKMSERLQNREKLKRELLLFCKTCIITILPFFILFLFISEWAFEILFGWEWKAAGFYLKCMLPWLFLVVLVASISFIPDLFFRQKTAMHIEIVYVILRILALFTGIYFQSFRLAVILYCGISALMLFVKLSWYFCLIKRYESSLSL